MAKSDQQEDTSAGTAVALVDKVSALPAGMDFGDEVEGLEGLGYSEKAEDTLVPIISILQDNSAEVKRQHAKYINGAMAGSIIIRAFKRVFEITKDHPLPVVPCGFQHMWVQWRGEPGEGQVITQYPFDDRPDDAVEKPDPQNADRTIWLMPNGDRLVDTRYHYCLAFIDGVWQPVVIPMAGTNHTVSRQWTGQQKAIRLPNGAKAPAWFRIYNLSTSFNSRGAQSWFNYNIDDFGWNADRALRDQGRAVFESVSEGILSPDEGGRDGAGTAGGGVDTENSAI